MLGDLGLRSSSGINSIIGSADCSFPGVGDRSLTCLSGEYSCNGLVDLSSTLLLGDRSGVGGGVGVSTCRSFTDCFIIVSVMEDCRITIAFMRSTIFFLCALISFLILVISQLKL